MAKRRRLTVMETGGDRRAYSYLLHEFTIAPLGEFRADELTGDLEGELEAMGQSDSAPAFLWDPEGSLIVRVSEE